MGNMKAWDVYRNGRLIDTVYYTANCSASYVKKTLIDHDGYNSGIVVVPAR